MLPNIKTSVQDKIQLVQAESASLYLMRQNIEYQIQKLNADKIQIEVRMLKLDGKLELLQEELLAEIGGSNG